MSFSSTKLKRADVQNALDGNDADGGFTDITGATATYAVVDEDEIITLASSVDIVITLPPAGGPSQPGRRLTFINYSTNHAVSASANVVPIGGGAAGTALVGNTDGAKVTVKSDGTHWRAIA
jgi:hypothetical protein